MKIEIKLARAFRTVAGQEQQLESTASGILAIVRGAGKMTVGKFDKLVSAAYAANGWNARAGRPNGKEAKHEPVPGTVRTYVTTIRRAMRAKLQVGTYKTFTALRTALEAKKGRGHKRANGHNVLRLPAPVAEQFAGVDGLSAKPNGALFHDLGVLYAKLPSEHQSMFERQVKRIMAKYAPLVPGNVGKELLQKAA
jgi:hypothetical protein